MGKGGVKMKYEWFIWILHTTKWKEEKARAVKYMKKDMEIKNEKKSKCENK